MLRSFAILLLSCVSSFAQYKKVDVPVNIDGRLTSLHLFIINAKSHQLTLKTHTATLAKHMQQGTHQMAITVENGEGDHYLSIKNGLPHIDTTTKTGTRLGLQLLKQGTRNANLTNSAYKRHTFILQAAENTWILGYAPALTEAQLAYAIEQAAKELAITHAFLMNSGNSAAIWVAITQQHPFYLKELSPASACLMLKTTDFN